MLISPLTKSKQPVSSLWNKKMSLRPILASLIFVAGASLPSSAKILLENMVIVPAGFYEPFFLARTPDNKVPSANRKILVPAFMMDVTPVTNDQYLDYVGDHPEWQKSRVKEIFSDANYLRHWTGDLALPTPEFANQPVTNVSWFAAQAYCETIGKMLPTTEQWEFALADEGRDRDAVDQKSFVWMSKPNTAELSDIGLMKSNGYGISDLVGLVWEWTYDFDSFMTGTELRNTDGKDGAQFCGNGSIGVKDAKDYPAFMRYSLRTSLHADFTANSVGFRCARKL